jgi:hypothetical protein
VVGVGWVSAAIVLFNSIDILFPPMNVKCLKKNGPEDFSPRPNGNAQWH